MFGPPPQKKKENINSLVQVHCSMTVGSWGHPLPRTAWVQNHFSKEKQ